MFTPDNRMKFKVAGFSNPSSSKIMERENYWFIQPALSTITSLPCYLIYVSNTDLKLTTVSFSLAHPVVAVCAHAGLPWELLMADLIVAIFFFLHLMLSLHLDASCLVVKSFSLALIPGPTSWFQKSSLSISSAYFLTVQLFIYQSKTTGENS